MQKPETLIVPALPCPTYLGVLLVMLFSIFLGCHARIERSKVHSLIHTYQLGDSKVEVQQLVRQSSVAPVFIQLHDDEQTAEKAARTSVEQYGGIYLGIRNGGRRNLSFRLNNRKYSFDPNRIFTATGRTTTMKQLGNYQTGAGEKVMEFSRFLLQLIPDTATIIAIHNNSNRQYAIDDYRTHLKENAASVFINPSMDPDDFVYTTNERIYHALRKMEINVVLQHNTKVQDDGSLSVYFGRQGRTYCNVEAEHGHAAEQKRMIAAVMEILKE